MKVEPQRWDLVLEWTVWCLRTVRFFVMFDMFEVRFWAKMWCSEVFEVRSCCYVTRLVLEHTVWCSWTVQIFVMFNMFEFQFWTKMWCLESSMFGHSMFVVFEVQYFGVCSKTSRNCIRMPDFQIGKWRHDFKWPLGETKLVLFAYKCCFFETKNITHIFFPKT